MEFIGVFKMDRGRVDRDSQGKGKKRSKGGPAFLVLAKMPEKASEELGRDQGNMVS